MFKTTIIASALLASLTCTTFVSAQSVRDKAVKAAYQGPEARFLKISGRAFHVKKATVRLGPGTRVVDGRISHVKPWPITSSIQVSYTLVFRRDGTLVEVSMRGAKSTGVFNAITKQTAIGDLLDGSWKGSVRYLVAEIGRAAPKDLIGTPLPPSQTFPGPQLPPVGDVMDGDEGGGDEGGGDPVPQSYFLGVSTSLTKIPSGHGQHQGQHQHHDRGQQRFSGDSYGLRINSVVPGSPAQRAGLEPGDIVIIANQKPMTHQDSLIKAVAESNGQLNLILRNVRNGQFSAVVVELDAQTSTYTRTRARRGR
jgi:hypothetical protein